MTELFMLCWRRAVHAVLEKILYCRCYDGAVNAVLEESCLCCIGGKLFKVEVFSFCVAGELSCCV
jgi:hypothetical protein